MNSSPVATADTADPTGYIYKTAKEPVDDSDQFRQRRNLLQTYV